MFLLFLFPFAQVSAETIQRAWFADSTGEMAFADVQQQTFIPYQGVLSRGYQSPDEVLWIRVTLSNFDLSAADGSVALRVRPPMLDRIGLFDPKAGLYDSPLMGDTQSHDGDLYYSPSYSFFVDDVASERTIWLRVQTNSPQIVSIDPYTLTQLLQTDSYQQLMFFIYLAAEFVFIIWGVLQWYSFRDELLMVFIVKQVLLMCYALGTMGYLHLFWPYGDVLTSDTICKAVSIACIAVSYRFDYVFFKVFKVNAYLHRLLYAGSFVFPLQYVLLALNLDQVVAQMSIFLTVILPLLSLWLAIASESPSHESGKILISRRLVIFAYAVLACLFIATSLNLFGVLDYNEYNYNGFLSYAFIWGLLFIIILSRRIRLIHTENHNLQVSLKNSEHQADIERRARIEKKNFLSMLTHELRTPLSVVQMALGARSLTGEMRHEAKNSLYEMSRVLSYVHQAEQLEENESQIRAERFELSQLLRDCAQSLNNPRISSRINETVELESDPYLLNIVVSNLLDNALKYSPPDSEVVLSLSGVAGLAGVAVVRVCNQPGDAGWPDKHRVFEKYYRSPAAQHLTGSGLGLHLSAALIQRVGGQLRYRPDESQVCFELSVPVNHGKVL